MKISEQNSVHESEHHLISDKTELDETGANHVGSNNTEENSEGRKEGTSYYEKLRELDPEHGTEKITPSKRIPDLL